MSMVESLPSPESPLLFESSWSFGSCSWFLRGATAACLSLAATFLVSAVRILILYPLRGTGKVLDGTDVALFGKRIKTL
jgi:hypothetical protein